MWDYLGVILEVFGQDVEGNTPETLFEGLVRNLHDLKKTSNAEQKRREHWLSSTVGDADEVV